MNNGLFDWYGIVKDRPERPERRTRPTGNAQASRRANGNGNSIGNGMGIGNGNGNSAGASNGTRSRSVSPVCGGDSSSDDDDDDAAAAATQPRKRIDGAQHPAPPKRDAPFVGRFDDGTWGPTGLYGGRVRETPLLKALRDAVKPVRLQRVEEVLTSRCTRVQCLFENLSDPANGAACLRTMEGLGVLDAHAVEAYEPFKVQGGVTMNAEKWMRVSRYRHCLDAANSLKAKGYTLIATCLDEDATPIDAVDFDAFDRTVLMFGNEERGLSYALRDAAHHKVYIPMPGFSQSFNISVSCAMTLYHLRRAGVLKGDLDDASLNDLYLRWLLMSTKRSPAIVRKLKMEAEVPDFM